MLTIFFISQTKKTTSVTSVNFIAVFTYVV
jgi:hypothetical protein